MYCVASVTRDIRRILTVSPALSTCRAQEASSPTAPLLLCRQPTPDHTASQMGKHRKFPEQQSP